MISLLQFFFIKCSNNFFTIKIINNICPWNCIFNFTNNKNFFRPVWCVSFSKNIFVFWNSYIIANNKLRIFIINLIFKINTCIVFNINRFHLNCSAVCIICTLIYTVFDIDVMYLYILVFKVLINLSATIYFPSFCTEKISILLSFNYF